MGSVGEGVRGDGEAVTRIRVRAPTVGGLKGAGLVPDGSLDLGNNCVERPFSPS